MLKTRVMPIVLLSGYNVVKSVQFSSFRTLGNPITVSRVYDSRGVDELVLLDIRATPEGRGPNVEIIRDLSGECFMPLTVGGGIKTVEQARELLRSGADKIAINTAAVENPALLHELSEEFGAQCVVVSIDAQIDPQGLARVVTHSGKRPTQLTPPEWAARAQELGAGEILLNSVDQDGVMKGFDLSLIRSVTDRVQIPVIACGGAGTVHDFGRAILEGQASAVAAASVFHFTSITPRMVKEHLHSLNLPVRL